MEDSLTIKPKGRFPVIPAVLIAAIASVGIGAYSFKGFQANDSIDLNKLTVVANAEDVTLKISANGSVLPGQTVNLSPKNSGRVAQIFVEQGDIVRQGQKIALMENGENRAQLLQYQASVRQAQANLDKSKNGTRPEEITQAQARLDAAQATLAKLRNGNRSQEIEQVQFKLNSAKSSLEQSRSNGPKLIEQSQAQLVATASRQNLALRKLQRFQKLYQEGAISQDRLDEATADYQTTTATYLEAQQRLQQVKNTTIQEITQKQATVSEIEQNLQQQKLGSRAEDISKAEADVRQAQSDLQQKQNGSRPEEIAQYQAALEIAQAQLMSAQVLLRDSLITAPFDGIITQRYASVGAFVTPTTTASKEGQATSTSVVAIAKDLEVKAKVPEVDIGKVRVGQNVEITVDAYPDQKFQGTVKIVAPEAVVEQNVTAFDVRLTINDDRAGKLKSGMNVNVSFVGEAVSSALMVPTVAIVRDKGKDGVLVPGKNSQPEFREVELGFTVREKTQITNGIKSGDRVFIDTPKGFKLKKDEPK